MTDAVRPIAYVLDQPALLDYASAASMLVPSLLASAIERDWRLAVSALALAQAYRQVPDDQADTLDLLTGGALADLVVVVAFDKAIARAVGRAADVAGRRHDLAHLHLAALARQHAATVITGGIEQVRDLLGPDWPIISL